MKAKLAIVTLLGLTACNLALAQNDAAAAPPATPTLAAADPVATEPAPPPPPAAPPAEAPAPGVVIPLIQFQDVPLSTAIDNLARQAGINYIMDPKVGFGQPDEKGQIRAQPNISIRWENLTSEQALTALVATYGLQLVEDPKNKIARVTIKDPLAAEPLETRVIQLKFASPSNMVAAANTVILDKRSRIVPDVRTSQLVVSATEKEQVAVSNLVVQLDTQTKQVLIEAKILETTLNPQSAKGVNWAGTLGAQKITFGNNAVGPTPAFPGAGGVNGAPPTPAIPGGALEVPRFINNLGTFANPYFLNAEGVSAVVSFLNTSADTKVISEPRVLTLDNQKATIDVGLLFPIVNTSAGTANTAGGSSISYSNLTVNLDVTPRIAANDYIELNVIQSVMRLGPSVQSTVGDQVNDVNSFYTRKLDTKVLIPSGNTLVMGGLVQDQTATRNVKVPLLGDIPYLGLLFRHDFKSLERQNLIIFITPTTVQDSDFQPTQSTYLKSTGNEGVTEGWNAWDSGKPKDWSKKASTEPDSPQFK